MEHKYKFYIVECDFCGAKLQLEPYPATKGTAGGVNLVELEQKGWKHFDDKPHLHYCPDCARDHEIKKQRVF